MGLVPRHHAHVIDVVYRHKNTPLFDTTADLLLQSSWHSKVTIMMVHVEYHLALW